MQIARNLLILSSILVSPSVFLPLLMMFCDVPFLFRACSVFIPHLLNNSRSLGLLGLELGELMCTQKAQSYLGAMFPPSILTEISVSLNSFTSKPLLWCCHSQADLICRFFSSGLRRMLVCVVLKSVTSPTYDNRGYCKIKILYWYRDAPAISEKSCCW